MEVSLDTTQYRPDELKVMVNDGVLTVRVNTRRRQRMAARWYQGCFPGSTRFHQQQSQRRSSLTYPLMEFLLSPHQRRTWPLNKSQKCTNSVFIFQQCLVFDFFFIGNTFMGHYTYLYVYITMIIIYINCIIHTNNKLMRYLMIFVFCF